MIESTSTTPEQSVTDKQDDMDTLDHKIIRVREQAGWLLLFGVIGFFGSTINAMVRLNNSLSTGTFEGEYSFYPVLLNSLFSLLIVWSITGSLLVYCTFKQRELLAKRYFISQ